MTDEQGGFYSSLDADSEGQEGKYYLWTLEDIQRNVIEPDDLELFQTAYGVSAQGNFEGANVLQRISDDSSLAKRFNRDEQEVINRLKRLRGNLLQDRQKRVPPGTDDKVLVSWNGLALAALAEAARYLHRLDYLEAAKKNARFLLSRLKIDGCLMRAWRRGRAHQNAYLEDYAALIQALLALYQSDPDGEWFEAAIWLAEQMMVHFRDPQGGFFDTGDEQDPLLFRPKDLQDNATPCGSSLAAGALLQLSAYTANGEWRDLAEQMLGSMQALAARYPTAFAGWLQDINFALGPVYEVAILGDPADAATRELTAALWSNYHPDLVAAISAYPPKTGSPPLLQERPLLDGKPTAYVCQRFVCQRPVNQPEQLIDQLGQS